MEYVHTLLWLGLGTMNGNNIDAVKKKYFFRKIVVKKRKPCIFALAKEK